MIAGNVTTAILMASLGEQVTDNRTRPSFSRASSRSSKTREGGRRGSRGRVVQRREEPASSCAALPDLRRDLEQARNRPAILVGRPPGAVDIPRMTLAELQLPQELPASVCLRRSCANVPTSSRPRRCCARPARAWVSRRRISIQSHAHRDAVSFHERQRPLLERNGSLSAGRIARATDPPWRRAAGEAPRRRGVYTTRRRRRIGNPSSRHSRMSLIRCARWRPMRRG